MFDHLLPEGRALKPYQAAGVATALVECADGKGVFLCDQMGLGKTLMALMAVEVAKAFPAVVVCPANLKANWEREVKQWFPHRQVAVLYGNADDGSTFLTDRYGFAEILVVGWPTLDSWSDLLCGISPEALVVDESHYAGKLGTQRTRALLRLSKSVKGLKLNLTGTPLLNRPEELISQLEVIDRLHDVTPRPRVGANDERAWRKSFRDYYCGEANREHLLILHEKMRNCCYIRRRRADVLGMNDTIRVPVYLSLNGALDEYRKAETDLIRFLYETKGASAARLARRSEALARISTLRRLAGVAKIDATCEWVDNFLRSTDKSLIVFAHHREVQLAMIGRYFKEASALIPGANPEFEKARFMSGESRLIVCSYAAREGHTLTKASDVLFVEEGWTPGGMQQAEDRANRLGQEADQVMAYYLLGENTFDEDVHRIVESKRKVVAAAGDGVVLEDSEEDVTNYLISKYERNAA